MVTIEARLLGPVTLTVDGTTVKAGGSNGRALLAALLLMPGQPVGVEQLVLDVWGDDAPMNARAQLHSVVSRLRTTAAPLTVSWHARLESYSLDIDPKDVDVTRFHKLTAEARQALAEGRPGQASALLKQALECWSGPALGGVRTHGRLETERRRLEELHLETLVLRNDADLRDGRAEAVLPGLRALVAEFPEDEQFRTQLEEALERSGRAAQAWGLRREQQGGRPAEQPGPAAGEPTAVAVRTAPMSSAREEPRISLLGPVQAWRGSTPISLGSPQQQAVLAMLAAQLGQRVSTEELVEGLWGDRPPVQAVAALRTYVSRLRSVLEPAREVRAPASRLVSASDGYVLRLPRRSVDMHVFEDGLAEARSAQAAGDHARAVRAATAALGLWESGGRPFVGIPGPRIDALRLRLVESWVAGQELRFESQLSLGAGVEIIAELTELTSEHPLRERLRELLMVALYRAGRQAEALGVYTDTRRLLIEELGVEPGAGLAAVHARILAADPSLLQPAAEVRQAEPAAPPPPAQLPSTVSDFTGRDALLAALAEALRGGPTGPAVPVHVLCGIGGVGKTTLAVHAAHVARADFPDGQLFADLRGAGETPADPTVVLGDFLYALGVHEPPDSYEQRLALYRSVLADRRMLIVLDNARDVGQVAPLIPGGSGSVVLVTSRSRLSQLPGASVWYVEEMTPEEAVALFTAIVGEARAAAEPEATLAVVVACGLLPIAVRVAAARLASRLRWSVADLARRLADQRRRLDELQLGNLAVETTVGLGYGQLSPEEARAFRLLSVVNSSDLPLFAAAALLDLPEEPAEALAESLVEANLLDSHTPGRYRFHDLLRLYAHRQNERTGDADEQKAALLRLLDLLLATVREAARELELGEELPDPLYDPPVSSLALAGGSQGVRDWLTAERPLILGAVDAAFFGSGPVLPAVELVVALHELLGASWEPTQQLRAVLVRAAQYERDPALLARIRYLQGDLYAMAGEYREAEEAYRQSLDHLGPENSTRLRAIVSLRLAVVLSTTDRPGDVLPLYHQALEISRSSGDAVIETRILANMARAYVRSGQPAAGILSARAAVEAARATGSTVALAHALYQLGVVLDTIGVPGEAVDCLREALTLYRSQQNQLWEGYSLARLAAGLVAVGRAPEAAEAAAEALALGQELDAAYCQGLANAALGEALLRLDRSAQGLARLQDAHAIFARLGVPEAATVRDRMLRA
ncbi:AfsR/SARP family transcriptional regulator [Kitasatospora cathayae]|uniref:BTAD domain-containing putative transcriptional regulator n=1 Tax=Kitasatospora cathayae TaxID=3004092 RepID=A0ABY7PYF5_9ACTN|nr:BTAD domain-containing putative transcriptional regulator [Kitasatospora sp. HUAS 3-15]WBP85399.1 BTAD domain-containing putative transcriptional regulator [Kitasatospora sp. HUAS 3-15]